MENRMKTNLAIDDVLLEPARRVLKVPHQEGDRHAGLDRIYPAPPTTGDSEIARQDRVPEGMGL
jgi:hypothetical protein